MKQEHIDLLKETLQQYGADFCENNSAIITSGNIKAIGIEIKRGRIYYTHDGYGVSVASSPITKAGIEKFVESYWYWSKK